MRKAHSSLSCGLLSLPDKYRNTLTANVQRTCRSVMRIERTMAGSHMPNGPRRRCRLLLGTVIVIIVAKCMTLVESADEPVDREADDDPFQQMHHGRPNRGRQRQNNQQQLYRGMVRGPTEAADVRPPFMGTGHPQLGFHPGQSFRFAGSSRSIAHIAYTNISCIISQVQS